MFFSNQAFSRIHVLRRPDKWALWWEAYFLVETLKKLNIQHSESRLAYKQVVYLPSKYAAPTSQHHRLSNKVLFDYFHGDPSISAQFGPLLTQIEKKKSAFHGVRVSHSGIEELLMNHGFDGKVFRIPLGIELDWFVPQSAAKKKAMRKELNIPSSAAVIGSFQKDGNGWANGNEPKLIKGPDILLTVLKNLKGKVSGLFVLLTGPARGYVKRGLERLGVPYKHVLVNYQEIGRLYHALDAYLITSREEGGPKGLLESMASGIPLVTTKVGMAIDLVEHGYNGWIVEGEDCDALTHWTQYVIDNETGIESVKSNARRTAVINSNDALTPAWRTFIRRFITQDNAD